MSVLDVYFGWTDEEYRGEGFTAIAFSVESSEPAEATAAFRAFIEEVAELAEAHPGIELLDGTRAIAALGVARQVRLHGHQAEVGERAQRQ